MKCNNKQIEMVFFHHSIPTFDKSKEQGLRRHMRRRVANC